MDGWHQKKESNMNNELLKNVLVGGSIAGLGVAVSFAGSLAIHAILSAYVIVSALVLAALDYKR